jgi:Subtilase family
MTALTLTRRWLLAVTTVVLTSSVAMAQAPIVDSQPAFGKADRTLAEQKLDSTLMYAVRAFAGAENFGQIPPSVQPGIQSFIDSNVATDTTISVVIKAPVSSDLVAALRVVGSRDIAEFPQYETITARVPITALLSIAHRDDVRTIGPEELSQGNRYIPTRDELKTLADGLMKGITNTGSVNWQGVTAHQADKAISSGIDGAGVKVCVLSDGVNSLAARQASGDLPATVTILSGQAGNGDEGTAMLEIIHDMAPNAALGFATAASSSPQFATNIVNLRSVAGCDIIVDDWTYFAEAAFQDGPIAQAVTTVTTAGALYFSSAANSGALTHGTSGTFEGDFLASGAAVPPAISEAVVLHSFGVNPYTSLTATSTLISLQWSDPLGGSGNDYDLFVMDSTGTTLLGSSTSTQSGTQDPYEAVSCSTCPFPVGTRIYVGKFSGNIRALRIDTHRGRISNGTTGSTFGHNAAGSGFSVAAVNVGTAGGGAFVGGATNPTETYSSDGPRKIFYQPNGAVITPGNVLFNTNGGTTLTKPDLAASDCGSTSTPGFTVFCGTSAAAPTSAAIAALIKSAKPIATNAQIKTALLASALDIEAAGIDRDSGVGIVMAPAAVRGVLSALTMTKSFTPASISAGGTSVLKIVVTNPNAVALQGVVLTDTYPSPQIKNAASPNPNVTGGGCSATLSAAAAGGSLAVTAAAIPASTTCTFSVTVTSSTAGSYPDATGALTTPIALNTAAASATLTVNSVAAAPVLQSVVLRRVHGAAGTFDLALSSVLTNPTTEPRTGPSHQLVFTYDKALNAATATVTEGTATPSSSIVGSTVVVNLTGVPNAHYVTVTLSGVGSTDGGTGGTGVARAGFLVGDVNQNRVVTVADLGLVNAQLAQVVTAANFLKDVNASGTLTVADKGLTNAQLTAALPAP